MRNVKQLGHAHPTPQTPTTHDDDIAPIRGHTHPTHVRQLPNTTTAHRTHMQIYANTGDTSHRRRTSSATREQRAKANRRYAKPTRPIPNTCGTEGKPPSHIAITAKSEIYIYGKIRNINERSSRSTGDGNAKPGSLRRRHESMPAHRANHLNRKESLP